MSVTSSVPRFSIACRARLIIHGFILHALTIRAIGEVPVLSKPLIANGRLAIPTMRAILLQARVPVGTPRYAVSDLQCGFFGIELDAIKNGREDGALSKNADPQARVNLRRTGRET
jgi:hypothetical protein